MYHRSHNIDSSSSEVIGILINVQMRGGGGGMIGNVPMEIHTMDSLQVN